MGLNSKNENYSREQKSLRSWNFPAKKPRIKLLNTKAIEILAELDIASTVWAIVEIRGALLNLPGGLGLARNRIGSSGVRMVIGRNSVEALLVRDISRIGELLVSAEERGRAQRILVLAQEAGIKTTFLSKSELSKRVGSDSHQGFVALVSGDLVGSRQALLDAYRDKENFIVVALMESWTRIMLGRSFEQQNVSL